MIVKWRLQRELVLFLRHKLKRSDLSLKKEAGALQVL